NAIFRNTSSRTLSTQVEFFDIPDGAPRSPSVRSSHRHSNSHSVSRDTGSLLEIVSKNQIIRCAPNSANALVVTSSRAKDSGSIHFPREEDSEQIQEQQLTGAQTSELFPPRHGFVVTGAKSSLSEESQVRQEVARRGASSGTDTRGLVDSAHKQIRVRPDYYDANVRSAYPTELPMQQQQQQQQQPRRTLEAAFAMTDTDVIDRTDRLTEADFEAWASQSLGRKVRISLETPEESRPQQQQLQRIVETDIERVVDPESKLPMKPGVAIRLKILSADCGQYKLADGTFISAAEAVDRGFIQLRSSRKQ
uniref:SH3 domain-containing protein n=1 Tax=Macrostomum lignano TaxID=282301 RepID=A0A1I8FKW0_9PLAT